MIIKLTVTKRGKLDVASEERLFDTQQIITPIRRSLDDTYTYFTVRTNVANKALPGERVDYQVTEDLSTIKNFGPDMVLLTVTSRNGRTLVVGGTSETSEQMIFTTPKVTEGFQPSGGGAAFLYCEDVEVTPVPYVVSEDIDTILGQIVGIPGDGTVTSVAVGNASPLFTSSVATAASTPSVTFALPTQNANLVYAGPSTGAAAAPTFRAVDAADIATPFELVYGTAAIENFTNQTNTTTLSQTPKANRPMIVFVDEGSGFVAKIPTTDYTVSGAVITWVTPLVNKPVMVVYIY